MKTFIKVFVAAWIVAAIIFAFNGEFNLLSGEDPQEIVAPAAVPDVAAEITANKSTTRQVQRGDNTVLWHDISLADAIWESACRDPDDPLTCSLVYRTTYRLPPEMDKSSVEHALSVWMGYSGGRESPMVSVSMEWFDEVVSISDQMGVPAENATAQYETAGFQNGFKPGVNWFQSDGCLLLPQTERFPRGSVACRFVKEVALVSEKMSYPPNWSDGNKLRFSVTIADKKSYEQSATIHEFHFDVPVNENRFMPLQARTMDPLLGLLDERAVAVAAQAAEERVAEEQRLANERAANLAAAQQRQAAEQLAREQEMAAKAAADAGPTFEETRSWILSKFNRYASTWDSGTNSDGASYTYNRIGQYDFGKGELIISNCSISSGIPFIITERGRVFTGYLRYSNFQLVDLFRVRLYEEDRSSYSGYPHINLDFRNNSGERTEANQRWDKRETKRANYLQFFFSYDGSENNMERRMQEALLRLSELAKENPQCAGPEEAF